MKIIIKLIQFSMMLYANTVSICSISRFWKNALLPNWIKERNIGFLFLIRKYLMDIT